METKGKCQHFSFLAHLWGAYGYGDVIKVKGLF